jgi:uridylate kinase
MNVLYKRILLKLSGESLQGSSKYGINASVLREYALQIKEVAELVQVGIVVGGGNIFRGIQGAGVGFERVRGDQMGMLATIINSLALQDALCSVGAAAQVFTSVGIESIGERFCKEKALACMAGGGIAIIGGGTGNPYFSTDTAAALRAIEIGADIMLKGTRVDGVYDVDPEKHTDAVRYSRLTFDEALAKGLRVMDMTAFALCRENRMPVIVFDMNTRGNLHKVITAGNTGTIIEHKQ